MHLCQLFIKLDKSLRYGLEILFDKARVIRD